MKQRLSPDLTNKTTHGIVVVVRRIGRKIVRIHPLTALASGCLRGIVTVAIFLSISVAQTTELLNTSAPPDTNKAVTINKDSATIPNAVVPDSTAITVEMQRRFNELRREILDDRARVVDWWLAATATFLTLLGIVAVIAGYISFKRFHEIEAEARENVTTSKQYAMEAQSLVEEIKTKRGEAASLVEKLNAENVGNDPDEAGRVAESVQGNPSASIIDQAIATAVQLQRAGEIKKAFEKWRAIALIAEESDNNVAARAWFSVGYLLLGDDPEASVSASDQAIRLKEDFAEAYINRGNAKHNLGRHDDAIKDFEKAIRMNPSIPEAFLNRAIVNYALLRYDDAVADYDEAMRLRPDYAIAFSGRAAARLDLGLYNEAIEDCNEAIRLNPDNSEAFYNRGTSKVALKRFDEAIDDFDEAVRLNADDVKAIYNLGTTMLTVGRHEEAVSRFNEAIRLRPDFGEAYANRGVSKVELGLKNEGRIDLEAALDLARKCENDELTRNVEELLHDLDSESR